MKIPNPITALRAIARAVRALMSRKPVLATREVSARRFAVCRGCTHFDPLFEQCAVCACFLGPKTMLATERCPLNKWR